MTSIEELEQAQLRRELTEQDKSLKSVPKKKAPILTMEQLLVKDTEKTIKVMTGLTNEQFSHILSLFDEHPEQIKRGTKLMDLNIRLVILLQWIHHGQTYELLGASFGLTSSRVQTAISSLWDKLAEILIISLELWVHWMQAL